MARPVGDPSGGAKLASIRLSPDHLSRLDAYCAEKGWSRSQVVARLIDRLTLPRDESGALKGVVEPPLSAIQAEVRHLSNKVECKHPHKVILAAGLARCQDCGMRRHMDGVWRPE